MGKSHLEHYENSGKIDLEKIHEQINKLKVIVHPIRYAIIVILINKRKMNVTAIYRELSISQAATSGHLKLMCANDILCSKKVGKNSIYSLNFKTVKKLMDVMRLGLNRAECNKINN